MAMEKLMALYQAGKWRQAEKHTTKLLKKNPTSALLRNVAGAIASAQAEYDSAKGYFSQAVQLQPDYAEAHNNLGVALQHLGEYEESVKEFQMAFALQIQFPEAHFNLGISYHHLGQFNEALTHFKYAIQMRPDYAMAFIKMGHTQRSLNQSREAMDSYQRAIALSPAFQTVNDIFDFGMAFYIVDNKEEALAQFQRVVKLDSKHSEAIHLIHSLTGKTTSKPPQQYVERLFNDYASRFDHDLVDNLGYDMPSQMKSVLLNTLGQSHFSCIVDLGCGTGLAGDCFKAISTSRVGVDLSAMMLVEAQKKGCYDKLYCGDVVAQLKRIDEQGDLLIAADVLIYLGDVMPLFNAIKDYASKGALLLLSTEHTQAEGFKLEDSGRYSHGRNYMDSCAKEVGFSLLAFKQVDLRKSGDDWIAGGIYLFQVM